MTPNMLLVVQVLTLVVSACVLYVLMRRYLRQPALWPVPGIYVSLVLVYLLENHFTNKLYIFLGWSKWLRNNVELEVAFWIVVFLLILLRYGKESSKYFLGLAFIWGLLSIFTFFIPRIPHQAIRNFFQLKSRGDISLIIPLEAISTFCVFLGIKALCYRYNKPVRVSELALFAVTNLEGLTFLFIFFLLF